VRLDLLLHGRHYVGCAQVHFLTGGCAARNQVRAHVWLVIPGVVEESRRISLTLRNGMFRLRSMRPGQWPRRRTCHGATVAAIQARACYSSRGPLGFSNAPSEIIREAGGSGVLESSTRCTFGPSVSSSGWVLAIFTGVPIRTSA